jgi:hypothetical protein
MRSFSTLKPPVTGQKYVAWIFALGLAALAAYPTAARRAAVGQIERRLNDVEAAVRAGDRLLAPLDAAVSLRVARLGPLLASWETIGGCGAGGTGGAGVGVKWIGRNTTGGFVQSMTQANYIHFTDGFNFIATEQISRDLSDKWNIGVFVPYVYKFYRDYLTLPVDISNAGLGDINVLVTGRFGRINATSVTAALGLPTGVHDARYKGDLLTQEKQLGLGKVTASLIVDHTIDKSWGLLVLGGVANYRGGENELGNYRAPAASLYSYGGYFMGPLVPTLGLALTGFLKPDRDRGIEQDVPLLLLAANASIEWSTPWVAVLLGVSVPYSFVGSNTSTETIKPTKVTGLQPWTVAIGVSVSPF